MLKKSLSVSIFVLLFIGLSDYGYGCHKIVDDEPVPHGKKTECNGGGGGGGGDKVVGEYFVDFNGEPAGETWFGHANESRISGNNLPGLIGQLEFFVELFDEFGGNSDGHNCFEIRAGDPVPVGFGGVQRKPGPTAYGQFWFPGCTMAGDNNSAEGVCDQEVLYRLEIFGDFHPDYFEIPLEPTQVARMVMLDWKLGIAGEKMNILSNSCIGESEENPPRGLFRQFNIEEEEVVIRVERCAADGCL